MAFSLVRRECGFCSRGSGLRPSGHVGGVFGLSVGCVADSGGGVAGVLCRELGGLPWHLSLVEVGAAGVVFVCSTWVWLPRVLI